MMSPDEDLDWNLLDRYLSGRCTPEESDAMRQWAASDPSRARVLASVKRIWDEAGHTPQRFDVEVAVRALESARRSGAGRDEAHDVPRPARRSARGVALWPSTRPAHRRRASLAAAAALVITASVAAWHWRAGVWPPAVSQTSEPAREYATAPGQRAQVLLTDGTRVWLNVDSRLRVPADFGASIRRVDLEGEAYFEVAHDDRRPFRVRAAYAMVEDLGTKFLVRAYAGDSGIDVAVAEGKVALGSSAARAGRGVPLVRGQRGEIDGAGMVTVSGDADIDAELSWRDGRLALRHVPLSHAVRELERWYGVDIALADTSLSSVIVTASFGGDSIDDALRILSGTLGVRYTRQGAHVRLLPGDTR
jgi:ferric-dicitrate binding protein FerR (iron transport regulator)